MPGLINGQQYEVSFYYAARANYGVDGLLISYNANPLEATPLIAPSTNFTLGDVIFTASGSGTNNIVFAGSFPQGPNAAGNSFQDFNVAVDAISISAVPNRQPGL